MRLLILILLISTSVQAQFKSDSLTPLPGVSPLPSLEHLQMGQKENVRLSPLKWRMTGNRWLTGGLVVIAGASKGFNETLMFHWKIFHKKFPNARPQWYNPAISWTNKYKNGKSDAGAKFPLSTTALVMFTDQYHLNTFINRMAWTSTLVIKIGEGKKPLKHYLLDFLYYSVCHQVGFAATYYPFKK
jgi:hypothetical protein